MLRWKYHPANNGYVDISYKMQTYLAENGIDSQTSCIYAPEHKGVVENKNKH